MTEPKIKPASKSEARRVAAMMPPKPAADVTPGLLLDLIAILEHGGSVSDSVADAMRKRIAKS